ncbi:copper homeostasis protein CutC [Fundicoccus culcitae]|uniref:PF03932 family protein CutC n=1 Tax=Fundicoccus culcitae TaxID=2969821 RepID=A0ABY5P584_9LACT|nr:copper homeostasis protein CutC [Fundicoccus culcitae]UUX33908.1 copper homeostasis protein CutC [Fundicoccus culcitae]
MIIELCAASLHGCLLAEKYGLMRIELNSALELGGLTPSVGLLEAVLEQVELPIVAMLRPRPGGFNYSQDEQLVMLKDLTILLSHPIEGVAFGALNEDKGVDEVFTKQLVDLCHQAGKKAVFHRAFDVIEAYDSFTATEKLIELGVDRILTSGRAAVSMNAIEELWSLQNRYGKQIDFVVGAGIKPANMLHIQKETGIDQLHGSFSQGGYDVTSRGNGVTYGVNPKSDFTETDEDQLKQIQNIMDVWMSN